MNDRETKREAIRAHRERAAARSEAKNQAVRDSLEPLAPGERPLAVTVASIAAGVLALANVIAYLVSNGLEGGHGKALFQTVLAFAVLSAAAIGMWKVKYWAVLGFQALLGIQIIIYSLSLMTAEDVAIVFLFVAIIIACGVLFWYLIRAMARIQMPEAPDIKELEEKQEDG